MRKKLFLLLILACFSMVVQAQDLPDFSATLKVDSAFARALPAEEADMVASLFRDDPVDVVSRSLDGLWFEVRRPGRLTNLGWVFNDLLEWDFKPEELPLGDLSTGVLGPNPLTEAPAFGAYLLEGLALRQSPSRFSPLIINIPPLVTIPVLERNQDGSWLHVNYLGYDGWVIGYATRKPDVMAIPEAVGLPPLQTATVIIVPVEIQQAQIDRLRVFITEKRDIAVILESFWWDVFRGAVKPCEPPAAVLAYDYNVQDVQELPELGRLVPRVTDAIDYLNDSIDPINHCGVLSPDVVGDARDDAINAKIILNAELERLAGVEEIVQSRR
ncbi:MAG: SH3 domain-containing protein [Anaerolineae bacterium]|nr:SH3 domain-containing protein [Anaerolineae bacterium]